MSAERIALVTGAASGIGKATVRLLAKRGWRVGAIDLNLDHVAASFSGLADAVVPLAADVSDVDALRTEIERFARHLGVQHLDLLVNCAGLLYTGHFEDHPPAGIHLLLAVNNLGVANGCHAAFPLLLHSARSGHRPAIVNLSSASAAAGIPGMAVYSASKFWVKGFTEALAVEWSRFGIAVRDVIPPFVRTPMLAHSAGNPFVDTLGVTLTPEQVAQEVVKAARYGPLHRIVSAKFLFAYLLTRLLPGWTTRAVLKRIGGYTA